MATAKRLGLIGLVVGACAIVGCFALVVSSGAVSTGTLRVKVGLGDACSQSYSPVELCREMAASRMRVVVYSGHGEAQTNQILVAAPTGQVSAVLPAGSYWIAFDYRNSATITNRGRRPFAIAAGQTATIPPIAPDKYAIQVGAETPSP